MEIKLKVKEETLAGVLDAAGSRYWCKGLRWPDYDSHEVGSCWQALLSGTIAEVVVLEDAGSTKGGARRHKVTCKSIAKALQLMLNENHGQLGNVLLGYESSGTDATTGDVLLQFAALGEERYA